MTSKRSRHGRRGGPPRYYYFPWDEERKVRRERELARVARQSDEIASGASKKISGASATGSVLSKSPSGIRS